MCVCGCVCVHVCACLGQCFLLIQANDVNPDPVNLFGSFSISKILSSFRQPIYSSPSAISTFSRSFFLSFSLPISFSPSLYLSAYFSLSIPVVGQIDILSVFHFRMSSCHGRRTHTHTDTPTPRHTHIHTRWRMMKIMKCKEKRK